MDTTMNEEAVVSVPTLVRRALQRCAAQYQQAYRLPHRTHADNAVRAARLAVICDRESRWFGVLNRWVYSPQGTVPLVFGQATVRAESRAMVDARFWAETAAYYRGRLAGLDHDEADVGTWAS